MQDYYIALNLQSKLHANDISLNKIPYIYHISPTDKNYSFIYNKNEDMTNKVLSHFIDITKQELIQLVKKLVGEYKKVNQSISQSDIVKLILNSKLSLVCYSHNEFDDVTFMSSKDNVQLTDELIGKTFNEQELLSIAKDAIESIYKKQFNKRPMIVYMNFNDSYIYVYNELRRAALGEYTQSSYKRDILTELSSKFSATTAQYIYELIIQETDKINK